MILCSILASLCLVNIAILMTNGLSLMVSSEQWSGMIAETNYYGAVLGTANNFANPVLWLRLATMFGIGLITAGIWATFDAHFLVRSTANNLPENYRQWTTTLALLLTCAGVVILTGTEYAVKTDPGSALAVAYPLFGWVLLLACVVFVVLLLAKTVSAKFVGVAALLHFLTLAGFASIRQIGQNNGMATFIDVSQQPEKVQWDPLIAFLVCFLIGLGVIVWMVVQCVKCADK